MSDTQVTAQQERPEQKPMRIVMILPTNAYFISGIRDFTLGLIKNTTKFSEQWAYRFQSVVDELCNNAIEYGSAPESDIQITFIVEPQKSIQIQVEDTGTGKMPNTAAKMQELMNERLKPDYEFKGIRGRGLAKIVSGWTDKLEFEDRQGGGLKVIITKYIDKPEEAVAAQDGGVITIHAAEAE